MIKISHDVTLVVETCCNCGTPFGIEANLQENFRRHGASFYCPNGHKQYYAQTTDAKIKELERQLKTAQDNSKFYRGEAEHKARQLSATRGVLTRTKNRIHNGVCPCCNRQFVNLARHMKTKHADYTQEEPEVE
jgi:hypothetical protein